MSLAQVTALLSRIVQLPVWVESIEPDNALSRVLSVEHQQKFTAYDAANVDLALRYGLLLAITDEQLRQVARIPAWCWFRCNERARGNLKESDLQQHAVPPK